MVPRLRAVILRLYMGAFGTPTLLFLDAGGRSVSEPKYGVPDAIDFYSYQIERTLELITRSQ